MLNRLLSTITSTSFIDSGENTGAMIITIVAIIGITAVLAIAIFKNKD